MLIREAQWVEQQLATWDANAFPLLNVGSHTADFRERVQPWIDRYLFAPLRRRGFPVVHSDLQSGDGIDLVGDLTVPAFLQELRAREFGSVICTNLLEHVPNRAEIARSLVAAVRPATCMPLCTCGSIRSSRSGSSISGSTPSPTSPAHARPAGLTAAV